MGGKKIIFFIVLAEAVKVTHIYIYVYCTYYSSGFFNQLLQGGLVLRDCVLFGGRPAAARNDFGVHDRPMAVHGDLDFSSVFCTSHFPRVI